MAKDQIKSAAIPRAGYEYQDLIGIDVLIRHYRDPEFYACMQLPIIGREYFVGGYSRADGDKRRGRTPGSPPRPDFPFLTGQPEEIRQAFRRAMGLNAEVPRDVRTPG